MCSLAALVGEVIKVSLNVKLVTNCKSALINITVEEIYGQHS